MQQLLTFNLKSSKAYMYFWGCWGAEKDSKIPQSISNYYSTYRIYAFLIEYIIIYAQ